MIYLLDVNVLIGLLDPRHSFHLAAHRWVRATIGADDGWATCAITENGCLRIGSTSSYAGSTEAPFESMMAALIRICQMPNHHFWPLSQSLRTILPSGVTLTAKQVTDVYLLGIAVAYGGKFATFDTHIPAPLIASGVGALEVIPIEP